ncbi:RNA polymerase subunit sigma [Photobacterium iliopiscarium]|jgi:hypothetical protein|uniref:DUF2500 domain-containing protein n=1 Tax=Photobacterium iliopiscarium TaxID=56192 RepID=A0A0D8Q3Q0_9GAMM|nr:DUF2500 domain-containing protein [Photobacterium iliopiscarium]KJG25455.1 RNA polymerase subunit sigma [Photobacterium iliopiscarium]PST94510.1 DUF2500 domain-containing protein [Photobacterium iliopiscarium]PST99113.1 DUF2500 domain-containing protein [Photobacterium iliopiscarium]PSV81765.1 DUF2500 domain-containing protein [Photobacterium iliopiscarium]PSV97239.1 DUF2500 domain-containing protein [Photobacterium iliopiscarium]
MPTWIIVVLCLLLLLSLFYFIYHYRRHILGIDAPEKKVDVQILDKQSNRIIGAQPGEEDEEYWFYVQPLAGGPKREFMIGIHYYQALNPGDIGTMTYRGQQFIHFALQRQ